MIKISSFPAKIKIFLKEVYLELKKVNWLSRREVLRYTIITVIVSGVVAAILGALDFLFATILSRFIL